MVSGTSPVDRLSTNSALKSPLLTPLMQQTKAKKVKKNAGGKKNRKISRHLAHCLRYRLSGRRERHKLKRVLHSSGIDAAKSYAARHNLQSELNRLTAN